MITCSKLYEEITFIYQYLLKINLEISSSVIVIFFKRFSIRLNAFFESCAIFCQSLICRYISPESGVDETYFCSCYAEASMNRWMLIVAGVSVAVLILFFSIWNYGNVDGIYIKCDHTSLCDLGHQHAAIHIPATIKSIASSPYNISFDQCSHGKLQDSSIAMQELRWKNFVHSFPVHFTARWEIYNPAIILYKSKLHMYARLEGRNATGKYDICPNDSLYTPFPCPVNNLRMISFIAHCDLSAKMSCK